MLNKTKIPKDFYSRTFKAFLMDIENLSKELMYKQTLENKAPAWLLTKIAIAKGRELAKIHNVNERLVVVSLYLAHTIFAPIWGGEVQKNHPKLSSEFVKQYLDKWNVNSEEQEIIINSIETHHDKVPTNSKVAEVVKNAECFKFVTMEGSLILLHELGKRNISFDESVEKVLEKMQQKKNLLTLPDCLEEATENCKEIQELFNRLS